MQGAWIWSLVGEPDPTCCRSWMLQQRSWMSQQRFHLLQLRPVQPNKKIKSIRGSSLRKERKRKTIRQGKAGAPHSVRKPRSREGMYPIQAKPGRSSSGLNSILSVGGDDGAWNDSGWTDRISTVNPAREDSYLLYISLAIGFLSDPTNTFAFTQIPDPISDSLRGLSTGSPITTCYYPGSGKCRLPARGYRPVMGGWLPWFGLGLLSAWDCWLGWRSWPELWGEVTLRKYRPGPGSDCQFPLRNERGPQKDCSCLSLLGKDINEDREFQEEHLEKNIYSMRFC